MTAAAGAVLKSADVVVDSPPPSRIDPQGLLIRLPASLFLRLLVRLVMRDAPVLWIPRGIVRLYQGRSVA